MAYICELSDEYVKGGFPKKETSLSISKIFVTYNEKNVKSCRMSFNKASFMGNPVCKMYVHIIKIRRIFLV